MILAAVMVYQFAIAPIDVVIPAVEKDLPTLELCIQGIRKYAADVRRVIVVSERPLTDKAEWFDEAHYPFSKERLPLERKDRLGWYFQQLLKLYAPFTIPDISPNVLVCDADVIFLRPVEFLNEEGAGLYTLAPEYIPPYFEHIERLLPGLQRVFLCSGIAHHMVFQKCVLQDLFSEVEEHHGIPFWEAFCQTVDPKYGFAGASEYEIYFNFVCAKTHQVGLRALKWASVSSYRNLEQYQGYHYVACHSWMR